MVQAPPPLPLSDIRGKTMLEVEEFVEIGCYEDMSSRPNFHEDLNFSGVDEDQVKVLSAYVIGPDMIHLHIPAQGEH